MSLPETVHAPVNGMATALMARLSTAFSAVTGQGAKGTDKTAAQDGRSRTRPRVIAMKPLDAPSNRFPRLLVDAMTPIPGHSVVPFEWSELGKGAYDVVVFHWPTEFFRPGSRRKTLDLLRRALIDKLRHGTTFVWLVHNLQPHDGGSLASPLTTHLFLRLLGGVIFLSEQSQKQLYAMHPITRRIKSLVTAHGVYPDVEHAPKPYSQKTAAGRILFFGVIRAYKNPVGLVRAARDVRAAPFSLHIAGRLWEDESLRDEIVAAAAEDARITLDLRADHIPEDELERLIDDHDAVVLPYDKVLNSGVAFHALCRNKPILAPAVGSLPELRDAVGPDWVHLFEGPLNTGHLETFAGALAEMTSPAPDMSRFAWDRIGRDTAAFLTSL